MATWKDFQQCAREEGMREFSTIGTFWREYQDMKTGKNIRLTGNILDPEGYKGQLLFSYDFMSLTDAESLLSCLNESPPAPLPKPNNEKVRHYYDKLWITEKPKLQERYPDAIWNEESWLHPMGAAPRRFTIDQVKELSDDKWREKIDRR